MLTINTNVTPSTSSIDHAHNFFHALNRYNGKIYLAKIGRFMLLMKGGGEDAFEYEHLVKPIDTPEEAAKLGFVVGAEKALWNHYRQTFGKKAPIEAMWNAEAVVERGGIQVHIDYDVFMYPKAAQTTIDGIKTVVHGEHCAVRFADGKAESLESTMYEPYRDATVKFYNENFTRVLSDTEMPKDAEYQANHKPYFKPSNSDRMGALREWFNEAEDGAAYDMIETLEAKAKELFAKAYREKGHVQKAQLRVNGAEGRRRKMLGRDLIDLDIVQKETFSEAMVMKAMAFYLETLIVSHANGGFEEQNFEFGGQLAEIANHWQDMFDCHDTCAAERNAEIDFRFGLKG